MRAMSTDAKQGPSGTTCQRFVFLLLPGFSAFDLTSAVEVLKDANREADQPIYEWLLLTETGASSVASSGLEITVHDALIDLTRRDRLVVLAGENYTETATKPVLGWLRRHARMGGTIGGISSGVYPLLCAGALPITEICTHWAYRKPLQESFEGLDVQRDIFRHDDTRFSCAGGAATLDLMLHFVAMDHGQDLATQVADSLVISQPRTAAHEQRISQSGRMGERNGKVAEAVTIMKDTLESPISPSQIANEIGISTRQLERLFLKYLSKSPKAYYMRLRLEFARGLLLQTDMKVIDVAMASGFSSASHFSKVYRRHFDVTPYKERGFRVGAESSERG